MSDYYGRDLPEIRAKLIERIKSLDSTLTQFTGSDPGMIIVDSIASVADDLNYYIDRSRLEKYIASCTQEDSLLRLARLTSYFIRGVQPPSAELVVTSDIDKSITRLQLYFDDAPYCIVDPIVLDATNNRTTNIVAYNGELKSVWVPITSLSLSDPKFILGSFSSIPAEGLEVSIEIDGVITALSNTGWFASKTIDDTIELSIRDNRIQLDGATKVLVKYISIKEEDFTAIDVDDSVESLGMTFVVSEGSTSGSGPENYEDTRRNIINSNRLLYAPVSVPDFQAIAEQDLEVARAVSFDWNTPSITNNPDEVQTYILLNYDSTILPNSVVARLNKLQQYSRS